MLVPTRNPDIFKIVLTKEEKQAFTNAPKKPKGGEVVLMLDGPVTEKRDPLPLIYITVIAVCAIKTIVEVLL